MNKIDRFRQRRAQRLAAKVDRLPRSVGCSIKVSDFGKCQNAVAINNILRQCELEEGHDGRHECKVTTPSDGVWFDMRWDEWRILVDGVSMWQGEDIGLWGADGELAEKEQTIFDGQGCAVTVEEGARNFFEASRIYNDN